MWLFCVEFILTLSVIVCKDTYLWLFSVEFLLTLNVIHCKDIHLPVVVLCWISPHSVLTVTGRVVQGKGRRLLVGYFLLNLSSLYINWNRSNATNINNVIYTCLVSCIISRHSIIINGNRVVQCQCRHFVYLSCQLLNFSSVYTDCNRILM